jgi:putative aminopeptidase FrvX
MNIENKDFIFSEFGVSGREDRVREKIEKFSEKLVDEIIYDVTGSLICVKKGHLKNSRKRIMLSAHMDTIGFIITYIDEKGFLRFSEVGEQPAAYLLGKRVIFENEDIGVVGIEKKEYESKLNIEKMFIDIGAEDRTSALKRVKIGDMCAVYSPWVITGNIITGGWMDDRIGCFILMEVMEKLEGNPHDILFVFSAQEEVGLRGVQTSSYKLKPDIGLAVDVTASSDLPEGELVSSCMLGKGAGIKIMDRSVIVPKKFIQYLTGLAEKHNIPFQRDIMSSGHTGAHAIQLSRSGVMTGGISVPVRYVHSAGELCSFYDVRACSDLALCFCKDNVCL